MESAKTVNKSFQGRNINSSKLLGDLKLLISSLKTKMLPPSVEDPDFKMFDKDIKSMSIDAESESSLRNKCMDFVIELIKQLNGRYLRRTVFEIFFFDDILIYVYFF